ncbi:MAG: hypothetical protein LQ348_005789 [Seirophora lacunosa]|nr:MAG: hypothetical protein LQ348_005789 [Seirophora lacunosa]
MLCLRALILFLALAHAATVQRATLLKPLIQDQKSNATTSAERANPAVSPGLNATFVYGISGTGLVLYINDNGERLPEDDINACLQDLSAFIIRRITFHGDGRANAKNFRRGVVRLLFTPIGITWKDAGKVVDALEAIVTNDHWTFASHVKVHDRNVGIIGYLTIGYQALGAATSISASSNSSSTTASSQASAAFPPRPESPYVHVVPGTHISITCDGFGRALNTEAAFAAFSDALIATSFMVRRHGPFALTPGVLAPWRVGGVALDVYPAERLRWFDLLIALEGLVEFIGTFRPFEFAFDIRWQGVRLLALGALKSLDDEGTAQVPPVADA